MAINTVYYRGKTGVYGTLNTDDYVFNNFTKGAGMAFFNKDIYPYVKIDNEYFLNDGESWDWKAGENSATLMSNLTAFLWDNGRNMLYNSGLSLISAVEGIGENDFSNITAVEENCIDNDGYIVLQDHIQNLTTKRTIPNYNIIKNKTQKNFNVLSFNNNIKKTFDENQNNDGHYIFSEGLYNTKYWGFKPQIYPIVVFNNTSSGNDFTINSNVCELNTHVLRCQDNVLIIDDVSVEIKPDDVVVFYIRNMGNWTALKMPPEYSIKTSWQTSIIEDASAGCLNFSPMQAYLWTPQDISFSFTANIDNIHSFQTNQQAPEYFSSIITKPSNFNINLPEITGSAYDCKNEGWLWLYSSLFTSIGSYSFTINSWDGSFENVELVKNGSFSLLAEVQNFEYISDISLNNSIQIHDYDLVEVDANISSFYLGEYYKSAQASMKAIKNIQTPVGTFPSIIGFYKEYNNIERPNKNYIGSKVEGLRYQYVYDTNNYSPSGEPAEEYRLTLDIGYTQLNDTPTFALGVVVWRNGKLLIK